MRPVPETCLGYVAALVTARAVYPLMTEPTLQVEVEYNVLSIFKRYPRGTSWHFFFTIFLCTSGHFFTTRLCLQRQIVLKSTLY